MKKTPILIAGGGPVGMTLALALARRGVACMLVERNPGTTNHPKMDITNGRSMELFQQLGVADKLREVAVSPDHNFDVSWITTLNGHELHRFPYPSVTEWRRRIAEINDGTMPSEAPMRVSQVEIEPVLQTAILSEKLVDARWGVALEEYESSADGVTVTLRRQSDGGIEQVRCDYLVGCDGGGSRVRQQLGGRLEGQASVMQRFMTHFRSDARNLLQRWGIAWHYQSPRGTLIAQNDRNIWTLHTRWPEGVAPENVDPHTLVREFAGCDFDYEILVSNAWTPHLLVCDRYTDGGRVFLAGDAAHQYIPTGGYGMNTGIGDACDLGWKLAAVTHGFGGAELLASYEVERRPVGLRNCDGSKRHNLTRKAIGALYDSQIEEAGEAANAHRRNIGHRIGTLGNAENESFGLELGYVYRDSPVVCADAGTAEASSDPLHYTPTTAPGARLPSVTLNDGRSIHSLLGNWFTLLCVGGAQAGTALSEAAEQLGIPLRVVAADTQAWPKLYGRGLLLVRPDHHVAWRGTACNELQQALEVLGRALGRRDIAA